MTDSAQCKPPPPPLPFLLPEIIEKILIEVLKREDKDVDILRMDNPFLDFFRCRGVNRTWRDCADSIIRKLGKNPQVQLSRKHAEYLFRDEYFAQFAPKLLLKEDEWEDPGALCMDRSLIPHYRDYLVRTLALRSPNVTLSRTIKIHQGDVATISTQFVIVAKQKASLNSSSLPVTLAFYSLNDVDCVYKVDAASIVMKMDTVSGVDGKEYVLLRYFGDTFEYAELMTSSQAVISIHGMNYRPNLLPRIPAEDEVCFADKFIIFFGDKQFTHYGPKWPTVQNLIVGRWPSFKRLEYKRWRFHNGTVHIDPRRTSADELTISVKKPNSQRITKLFDPSFVLQDGCVTEVRLESNVLFLGTSNGLMHAFILGGGGQNRILELDFANPDFSYRHELGESVHNISIARCNRETGMVRILVSFSDRLQVIEKLPSADFSW